MMTANKALLAAMEKGRQAGGAACPNTAIHTLI